MNKSQIGFISHIAGFACAFSAYYFQSWFTDEYEGSDFFFLMVTLGVSLFLFDGVITETKRVRRAVRFGVWMSANMALVYETLGVGHIYSWVKIVLFIAIIINTLLSLKKLYKEKISRQ